MCTFFISHLEPHVGVISSNQYNSDKFVTGLSGLFLLNGMRICHWSHLWMDAECDGHHETTS